MRKSTQDWNDGATVRVGFLTLRVVRKVATPGDWRPDYYELVGANGARYEFTPHHGLERVS